jgi:hypothetical protein
LRRAFDLLNRHGVGSRQLLDALTGYDGGKESLFRAQHKKCAYCERRVGLAANALEHLRPKKEAHRHLPGAQQRIDKPGYWWLTWTWSNHLFACSNCNTGHKKNYFPLPAGTHALQGPTAPYRWKKLQPAHLDTTVESPLLVDPATTDPLDHIEWRPVNRSHPKRLWKWSPEGLTAEGRATIRILGFQHLIDDVNEHVRANLLARTETICEQVKSGHLALAQRDWSRLGRDVASPRAILAGPSWNALHFLVDQATRTAGQLQIPARP